MHLHRKIIGALALLLVISGCATQKVVYVDKVTYLDKPCECPSCAVSHADLSKVECLASCRKDLVDLLDRCYRDNKNFVPNQQTMSSRGQYLHNVKNCISTGRFSTYKPGVEMCESICGN